MDASTPFTVLIISPLRFMNWITPAFEDASKSYRGIGCTTESQIIFKYVQSISDLKWFSSSGVPGDYLIVLVDTENISALAGVRNDLLRLDVNFRSTRTILVNARCRTCLPASCRQVYDIADKLLIPPMNTHLSDDEKGNLAVARKLIRLAAIASGATLGLPVRLPILSDRIVCLPSCTFFTTRMTSGDVEKTMDMSSNESILDGLE